MDASKRRCIDVRVSLTGGTGRRTCPWVLPRRLTYSSLQRICRDLFFLGLNERVGNLLAAVERGDEYEQGAARHEKPEWS